MTEKESESDMSRPTKFKGEVKKIGVIIPKKLYDEWMAHCPNDDKSMIITELLTSYLAGQKIIIESYRKEQQQQRERFSVRKGFGGSKSKNPIYKVPNE